MNNIPERSCVPWSPHLNPAAGLRFLLVALTFTCASSAGLSAQQKDIVGSRDHPMISRVEGSSIIAFSQKEFDEYLASKPPDLTTIIITPAQEVAPSSPPSFTDEAEPEKRVQRVLRADIKYLLSKFYLYYAMLPMREDLREQLTSRAVKLTKMILGAILVLIAVSFSVSGLPSGVSASTCAAGFGSPNLLAPSSGGSFSQIAARSAASAIAIR